MEIYHKIADLSNLKNVFKSKISPLAAGKTSTTPLLKDSNQGTLRRHSLLLLLLMRPQHHEKSYLGGRHRHQAVAAVALSVLGILWWNPRLPKTDDARIPSIQEELSSLIH
jgi:hypothetical protein